MAFAIVYLFYLSFLFIDLLFVLLKLKKNISNTIFILVLAKKKFFKKIKFV